MMLTLPLVFTIWLVSQLMRVSKTVWKIVCVFTLHWDIFMILRRLIDHIVCGFLTETLKHVAATVAGVKLSDHVVELVFTLFDENGEKCVHVVVYFFTSGSSMPSEVTVFEMKS